MSSRPSRRQARQRALDLLYAADLKERAVEVVLGGVDEALPTFTTELVRGVDAHRAELDGLIASHAKGWRVERMPIVDRNLLRLALFEMLYEPDVPDAVAIDEAVRLAKELSTDDSGRFVNGLLARIAKERAAPSPPSDA